MHPAILPIPSGLSGTCTTIQNWASKEPLIRRVYLFGSRFRNHSGNDPLELAIELVTFQEDDIAASFSLTQRAWDLILTGKTGFLVRLEYAHPKIAPLVWRKLAEGCGVIFDRDEVADQLPTSLAS